MATRADVTTKIFRVNPDQPEANYIEEAARILRDGGLVAFPTETVYGLGASIYHPESVRRIYQVKGRPGDNPLIVHLYSIEQVPEVAETIPDSFRILAHRFLPGPLTMILPKKQAVPAVVSAGLSTVAIRIPAHPVAVKLLAQAAVPVAAPSANLSGRPSPTLGSHVIEDLQGRVEMILDAGPTGVGVESTVLDLTGERPRIFRPGGISLEMLREVLGDAVEAPEALNVERPLAPGMKYRHYAPKAPLLLFHGELPAVDEEIRKRLESQVDAEEKVAILTFTESELAKQGLPSNVILYSLGSKARPEEAAHNLFRYLRLCDQEGVEKIYAVAPPRQGVGEAVYNRLRKAAGGNVVEI
mgnify:CR=1 FL=1